MPARCWSDKAATCCTTHNEQLADGNSVEQEVHSFLSADFVDLPASQKRTTNDIVCQGKGARERAIKPAESADSEWVGELSHQAQSSPKNLLYANFRVFQLLSWMHNATGAWGGRCHEQRQLRHDHSITFWVENGEKTLQGYHITHHCGWFCILYTRGTQYSHFVVPNSVRSSCFFLSPGASTTLYTLVEGILILARNLKRILGDISDPMKYIHSDSAEESN